MKHSSGASIRAAWARPAIAARGAALLTWIAASGGCDESGPRVYTAQLYRADLACLATYAPLGLVEAEDVSSLCAPACLALDEALYVSSVCPPFPAEVSLEVPESPDCAAALAAPACDDIVVDAAAP